MVGWYVNSMSIRVRAHLKSPIGLSLLEPTNPNIVNVASAAEMSLGSSLDGLLLGNVSYILHHCSWLIIVKEPDLYTVHGDRPGLSNYTTQDYFGEFGQVISELHNSPFGDLLKNESGPLLGGPTICCQWVHSIDYWSWLSLTSPGP
jgi:hypothetical protein